MKRIFTMVLLLGGAIHSLQAQYGYFRMSSGYSWNAFQKTGQVMTFKPGQGAAGLDPSNSMIVPMINQNTSDTSKWAISNVNSGYAKGATINMFGGYMINPYFGVELGLTYLFGSTISSTIIENDPTLGIGATSTTNTRTNGLSLMPGFYVRAAKPEAKLAPYMRLGLSVPVFGATYHELAIDAPRAELIPGLGSYNAIKTQINVKTESDFSIGANGGVGISYRPIPLVTIGIEMNGQMLFVKSKKSTLTKYDLSIDGDKEDRLLKLSTFSTVTEFVDKIDANSNTTTFGKIHQSKDKPQIPGKSYVDEDKPRQVLRTSANFNAIGFSVGVTINMSKDLFKNPTGKL